MVVGRRPLLQLIGVGLVLTMVLFLVGCATSYPQSTFDAAGPVAKKQLDLYLFLFWAALGVFVVVEGLLLYTTIRFRRRPGQQATPPQVHGNTRLEVAWTLAPAILVGVIGVLTVRTIFDLAAPPPAMAPGEEPLQVSVVGYQWWWEFQYADLGVTTANELHVPVGRAVRLALQSNDVIHSFWVPKLAGKTDVIPNQANTMWFRADRAGTYFGQCAEFCGIAHAQMRFRVVAEPEEAFAAWVSAQKQPPASPVGLGTQGAQVFASRGCAACHTIEGTTAHGRVGPDLTRVGSRQTLAAGALANTPENLARWLRNPQDVKPGAKMPNLGLSQDEIAALVAYLDGLR
ncbi:MAG: cytochrome c oxidase subunit II [Chloroflexi bacterium]|nr:cytochrome c oxidase subunit II [Chloroflexota bacterium]